MSTGTFAKEPTEMRDLSGDGDAGFMQPKKLEHVSASQLELFRTCRRKWHFNYILGLKQPPTKSQEKGTAIHAEVEHFLKTGTIRDSEWKELVKKLVEHLPDPSPDLLVEHEISMETYPSGPKWIGFIDVFEPGRVSTIYDIKTTSDFRYCKTPEELKNNIQMVSYARWFFLQRDIDCTAVSIAHVYGRTKGKPVACFVDTVLYSDHVFDLWNGYISAILEMEEYAKETDPQNVPPNTEACDMYGGCPYRTRCGLEPMQGKFPKGGKKMSGKKSLLERLAETKTVKGKDLALFINTPSGAVIESVSTFVTDPNRTNLSVGTIVPLQGVLPPDSPPRETTAEDVKALSEQKPKRGRKPKLEAKPPEFPVEALPSDAPVAREVVTAKEPPPGLTIFVDCYPVKTPGIAALIPTPILLEDWLAPSLKAAAEIGEVADYRLIRYESKGVLAACIRDRLDTVPTVLLASSYNNGTDVALDILIPYASTVIKGLRG